MFAVVSCYRDLHKNNDTQTNENIELSTSTNTLQHEKNITSVMCP